MDLRELKDLISVREYVAMMINNFNTDRVTLNELSGILLLLDKKALSILKSHEFKAYVNYQEAKKAIEEVRNNSNIKSSIKFK